jgi:hypothetical protein
MMLQCGIIAPVSSTSSQELDSARSRSGLFFAFFIAYSTFAATAEL